MNPDSPVFARPANAGLLTVQRGHVQPVGLVLPLAPPGLGMIARVQTFGDGGVRRVLLENAAGRLAVARERDAVARTLPFPFVGSRVLDLVPRASATPVVWTASDLGLLVEPGDGGWEFETHLADAGEVLDVAALTLAQRSWILMLYPDRIDALQVSDGGLTRVAQMDPVNQTVGTLKTDRFTRIVAAIRRNRTGADDVLSTFQVNVTSEGPVLTSPWPDCAPCGSGRHIELVAPSVRTGFATVDVVCMPNPPIPPLRAPATSALRVFGSVALTQHDKCITEDLGAPVSFDRVARTGMGLVHWDSQWGLLVGGTNGELWEGDTLTSIQPSFLDRVPLDVAPALAGRTPSIAVLAGDYLAIQQTPDNKDDANEQLNGFRRVPLQDLGAQGVDESTRLMGFVHGVGGWVVTGNGGLVRVNLGRGANSVEFGPRLVTSSEEPIRDTIGGEAFTTPDGGALGFFLAADDSLYFVRDPEEYLSSNPDEYIAVPVITPEPSVPIRSLALERTPLGTTLPTNGTSADRARGYLVTSRNVFSWELSGEPARWVSTPLDLAVGEPLEVWFDATRSALGRVGYRDGQIYSLPGGYPLAQALPEGPDGEPSQVIDFENLGGWPVAYTTTGLFIAGWDRVDGKLQNRFPDGVTRPMTWRLVTMPDGKEPWANQPADAGPRRQRTKPGKLFVTVDEVADGGQPYRLLLFTDDEVRQVAHHLRSNPK